MRAARATLISAADANATAGLRDIPTGPGSSTLWNINMSAAAYRMAQRIVLPATTTIDRWYFGVQGEGTSFIVDRTGYGSGNGGTWHGQMRTVNAATGFPTASVLGEETVSAQTRHAAMISEYGVPFDAQCHYIAFSPAITLQAETMYAFVLRNSHASPGDGGHSSGNHFSTQHNAYTEAATGPHAVNTLDSQTSGAILGLDPRECTFWSDDSGATWEFGDGVGQFSVGNGDARPWMYQGYRVSGGATIAHGWGHAQWETNQSGMQIVYNNVEKAGTITHAGGASQGATAVGVVTVRNMTTSTESSTGSLSSGFQRGALGAGVTHSIGDEIRITCAGSVDVGTDDNVYEDVLGRYWATTASGSIIPADRPCVFCTPWPYNWT